MAIENEGMGTTMLVQPSGNAGGFGGFGADGWWIILLFLLIGGNAWGGNGNNNGLYPWLNTNENISGGFRDAALNSSVNGIQNSITAGFGDVQNALCNGFSAAEIAANSRQMAAMNQNFALQSALQNCCCENRASIADLKYTVATENCADRAAVNDALRNVIENNNAGVQRILDQLCADKIDSKNEKIADLQRQLTMANLSASQNAQTQALLADNFAQTAALEQYLAPVPRPAYIVQNPNCCGNSGACM